MAARREPALVLAMTTRGCSDVTLESKDRYDSTHRRGLEMAQIQITKKRSTASARRRGEVQPELPLDPRDPEIIAAKRLSRRLNGDGLAPDPA
jgi:hypothetical protein